MRVSTSKPEDSLTEVELKLDVDREGTVSGTAEARLLGAEAGSLRALLLASEPTQYPEIVSGFLQSRGAHLSLDAVTVADVRELRRPLVFKGTVTRAKIWRRAEDESATLELGALIGGTSETPRERRGAALILDAPRVARVRARLLFPEDHDLVDLPPKFETRWDGGAVVIEARSESRRRLVVTREHTQRALQVPFDGYPAYRGFLIEVRRAETAEVTARRPAPRTPEY
jgi:hypothetical protein